jgi:patatin-like phospholipase/acyl hydrolase
MLWQLQERTGRRMHELFDLVCGTSTGGILAAALAIRCVSLEECEEIYRCTLASCAALESAMLCRIGSVQCDFFRVPCSHVTCQ